MTTLSEALDQVAARGDDYTVELMEFDGKERHVTEFRRSAEGEKLLGVSADLTWIPGSHERDGAKVGEIDLHPAEGQQLDHTAIVIRRHTHPGLSHGR